MRMSPFFFFFNSIVLQQNYFLHKFDLVHSPLGLMVSSYMLFFFIFYSSQNNLNCSVDFLKYQHRVWNCRVNRCCCNGYLDKD